MKRWILGLMLSVVLLGPAVLFAEPEKLIASNYSDRYHRLSCKVAQKISADEAVYFSTPEEAAAANLVPCKKCCPPQVKKAYNNI